MAEAAARAALSKPAGLGYGRPRTAPTRTTQEADMSERQVVVVGAGPAGVSAALALKDAGVRPLVLDQAGEIGSSWRGRYDRLRLNTCRPLSHLPDRKFAKGTPMFPTRDQLVEHLESHVEEAGLELKFETSVERVDSD